MIRDSKVDEALAYIAQNAPVYAQLVGRTKALEHRRKVVRGQAFLAASGTVAERDATAESAPEVVAVIDEIEAAETDKALIQTRMKQAELVIEVWRSQQANTRRANV